MGIAGPLGGGKARIVGLVGGDGLRDRADLGLRLGLLGLLDGADRGGSDHPGQDADDGDDHEEFDEREAAPPAGNGSGVHGSGKKGVQLFSFQLPMILVRSRPRGISAHRSKDPGLLVGLVETYRQGFSPRLEATGWSLRLFGQRHPWSTRPPGPPAAHSRDPCDCGRSPRTATP